MASVAELERPDVEIMPAEATTLDVFHRGEIDMQIATAKRYPRSLQTFLRKAKEQVTFNERIAEACYYVLPRGGKKLEGPSVRMAEICLGSWGNSRAESRVIEITEKELTSEAVCWDLENNVAVRVSVKRRITNSNGQRYNDDMITVTGNAANAIAFRNAVFKVIPGHYVAQLLEDAKRVVRGDEKTLVSRRDALIKAFADLGVKPAQICALRGKPGVGDLDLDDIAELRGVYTAIRDGDTSVKEVFSQETPTAAAKTSVKDIEGEQPTQAPAAKANGDAKPANESKPAEQPEGAVRKRPVKPAAEPNGKATPEQVNALEDLHDKVRGDIWTAMLKRYAVASPKDLTKEQAADAIKHLEQFAPAGDAKGNLFENGGRDKTSAPQQGL